MTPQYTYRASLVKVVDGDTVVLDVDLGLRISTNVSVRLLGVNAPERFTQEGKDATAFLEDVKAKYPLGFYVKTKLDKKDKYGRVLADLFPILDDGGTADHTVSQMIIDGGFAVKA